MIEVGAFEAKNKLGSLLDRVQADEELMITRHGKPAVKLTFPVESFDRGKAHAAAARIRARTRSTEHGISTGRNGSSSAMRANVDLRVGRIGHPGVNVAQ